MRAPPAARRAAYMQHAACIAALSHSLGGRSRQVEEEEQKRRIEQQCAL